MKFDDHEPVFSIGVAAKKLGIAVPTLRMYEKASLIIPFRTLTSRRLYSFADLERIAYIRHLIKDESLNLAGIRRLLALLPCWELKPCTPEQKNICQAYQDSKMICWMFPKTACINPNKSCRECTVYLDSYRKIDNLKEVLKKTHY